VDFYFGFPLTEDDRDYSRKLLRTKLNMCNVTEKGITNIAIQLFLKDFDKYANFKLQCPMKKGIYSYKGYSLPRTFSYPGIGHMKFKLNLAMFTKLPDFKKLIELYKIRITGEYKN
jgi:hypothetical protein